MLETIGWTGAMLLACCGVPQAVQCFRTKTAEGVSGTFLAMWMGGEILTLTYVWPKLDWPLITNYLFNIAFISIIVYYKILDKKKGIK